MEEYLNPGDNINWEVIDGFLKIGSTVITIIGLLIIVGTIGYAANKAMKLASGKGCFGKFEFKVISFALITGLLLAGGGWLTLLSYTDKTMIVPTKNIIQEKDRLRR